MTLYQSLLAIFTAAAFLSGVSAGRKLRHQELDVVVEDEEADSESRQRELAPAFTEDLHQTVCPGLVRKDNNQAPSESACATICANDPGCDAWQYCPKSINSCQLPDGSWIWANLQGRCYVATSSSSRGMCKLDWNRAWVGKARTGASRVPVKTNPITRKRGFSGYGSTASCTDAAALGLEDSWYYTWHSRPSYQNTCLK